MITLAKYKVDYVLGLHPSGCNKLLVDTPYGSFKVKTNSLRLQLFRKSLNCVNCNKVGTICKLQTHIIGPSKAVNCLIDNCNICSGHLNNRDTAGTIDTPHFNFFHVGPHGGHTLMTKDHIIPRSKGGSDSLDNLQTMCTVCNRDKSDQMPDEFESNGRKKRPKILSC
jgi:5-methylcytosine-specific restriction endonuclease McrA